MPTSDTLITLKLRGRWRKNTPTPILVDDGAALGAVLDREVAEGKTAANSVLSIVQLPDGPTLVALSREREAVRVVRPTTREDVRNDNRSRRTDTDRGKG